MHEKCDDFLAGFHGRFWHLTVICIFPRHGSTIAAMAHQSRGMTIFKTPHPLRWGSLDLPLFGLGRDWRGEPVSPAAGFSLAVDDRHLWFLAHHDKPAQPHPEARPGVFHADLWRHDVAELFLADPVSGRYFEFNLAPNGAWWCCEFTAPRLRADESDVAMPDVATFAEVAENGAWLAAMALPLDLLQARLDFGTQTRANVAFILGSPQQSFLSAADLGGKTPDFHQPAKFQPLVFAGIPQFPSGT
jgi:hypothetical protein